MAEIDGLWIALASPYRSFEDALQAIHHAREHTISLIAT